jgi:superfamily II DNA or RNA helicase/HKD family nuclease
VNTGDPRPPGLYDLLLTEADARRLEAVVGADRAPLGATEAARRVGRHLADYVARALECVPEDERPVAQIAIANRLVDTLIDTVGQFADVDDHLRAEVLRAISPAGPAPERPELRLCESGLYLNARGERRLGHALKREIASANRIDLVCAFMVWEGWRELRPSLLKHLAAGRSLRVLTTTYRGVTEGRVLDDLVAHGASVRVSYRSDATRLHAKAWIFHRDSGFGTAFVGSSNLSRSALVSGLEWNVRLSEVENRAVFGELGAAFEGYVGDTEFEPYDAERFAREVRAERPDRTVAAVFELRARPFQQEILDKIGAERDLHGRHQNLVVAATGTGKTVIAALDYQRLCAATGRRPTLLFVAHRREILRQSLDVFRHAMSDPSFGERWVDGQRPVHGTHVFASVQSLSQIDVTTWEPSRFEVVVVDEFHHADGETYRSLLDHLRPTELLGLTATPERPDGAPILSWFGGRISAELRVWDAIDRGLLVPFQYFAIHDPVSLANVRWVRGRLDAGTMEGLYTGHAARAHHVVNAVREHVGSPHTMKALGFCVGIEHARFMAEAFERAGLPAVSVTRETSRADRDDALARLQDGTLRCIFSVDVFNEGVDLPAVDTVLFLRPTESSIVFLQQLGRGLRRHPGKRCLTVIDLVSEVDRRFRYDVRYRVLLGGERIGRASLRQQIADGFPMLPSGCSVELDRVSRDIVLDNVGQALAIDRRSLTSELRAMGDVDLRTFLREAGLELEDLYRGGRTFTDLRRAADLPCEPAGPREDDLGRGIARLLHVDDRRRIDAWQAVARGGVIDDRLAWMLSTLLFGRDSGPALLGTLRDHPALAAEMCAVLALLDERLDHAVWPFSVRPEVPLAVHARYRLQEVMAAFGDVRDGALYLPREGEHFDAPSACNLLFVTLEKDEADYSPTTMYRDYALGPARFHWQTQSGTRPTDKKGLRHVQHESQGVTPLLFVRERRKDDRGETVPYVFLGSVRVAGWSGERPMNIEWELHRPMPARVLRAAAIVA